MRSSPECNFIQGLTIVAIAVPPRKPYRSTTMTRAPFRAAAIAAAQPALPPPTTRTSHCSIGGRVRRSGRLRCCFAAMTSAMAQLRGSRRRGAGLARGAAFLLQSRQLVVEINHRLDASIELTEPKMLVRRVNRIVRQADSDEHLREMQDSIERGDRPDRSGASDEHRRLAETALHRARCRGDGRMVA